MARSVQRMERGREGSSWRGEWVGVNMEKRVLDGREQGEGREERGEGKRE